MRKLPPLALALALPATAVAQTATFVTKLGNDTIAVERFTLTANRLEGELVTRGFGPGWRYSGDLADGHFTTLEATALTGEDSATFRTAKMRFRGDSVIADVIQGGNTTTQRLASRRGVFPIINLAFSFIEVVTRAGVPADTSSVPFFLVGGGQTLVGSLRRQGADSVSLVLGAAELVLKLDQGGRILRGWVPSQNVSIERLSGGSTPLAITKPDYSAPAGAGYTAEEVTIATPQGDRLAGTLTLPKARKRPVPVAVTISGSGLQSRDEALPGVPGYKPFRQIAEALAGRGIAVLRYDDRGAGSSTGDPASATLADFASDTRAVISFLRKRADVDAHNIFLIGHSEGAVIAPLIASTDTTLGGIVLLAGTARVGRKVIEYQNRYMIDLKPGLSAAARDSLFRQAVVTLDSAAAGQPWLRHFLTYDPLAAARLVRTPVLILHGETDRQVTVDQAHELAAAIQEAGNRDVTVHVLPNVNHLFLHDPSGNPTAYAALPDKQLVADVVDRIGDWVVKHVK